MYKLYHHLVKVDEGEQVQIDTNKHRGLIDYEVLAATPNAPLRIQKTTRRAVHKLLLELKIQSNRCR